MYKFIKFSVCFLLTLFLLSCNNDELGENQENLNNLKKNLNLNKFSNPNIVSNVEVDFESVSEFEKDNFKISEISAKEKVVNYFNFNLLQSQLKYQGITIEYKNKSYSYFLEIYAHKESAVYPMTITKLKNFSGTLNVYSFDGKNLGSIGLTKGMAKNISNKEDLDILAKAINLFSENSNLTNRIPPCNTPYFQPMQFMVSWYTETIVNNTVISYALTDTTTETVWVEMTYPCDSPAPEVARAYRYEVIGHSGSGSGSGGGDFTLTMPPPPDIPIADIKKYLSCFDITSSASLTVYAELMGNGNGVGHAFISITQGGNTVVYGYYPKNGFPLTLTGPSIMGENGGHHYNVSSTMEITGGKLNQIIALSQSYLNSYYDLSFYNCSDFATDVLNIAGVATTGYIDTPDTVSNILVSTPNYTIVSKNAPQTKRLCP